MWPLFPVDGSKQHGGSNHIYANKLLIRVTQRKVEPWQRSKYGFFDKGSGDRKIYNSYELVDPPLGDDFTVSKSSCPRPKKLVCDIPNRVVKQPKEKGDKDK